jgi:S-adenosyl methyltransferase
MDDAAVYTGGDDRALKPATAARMYDYYLGGVHNFPADREAAERIIAGHSATPAIARANRAFLRRAVRYLAEAGVRQFLDLGSGMPTIGNVHEIAQQVTPDARVVYVDIDPVAVAESMEILEGNDAVAAVHGDMRQPQELLQHPQIRGFLDFDQPIGLLLVAVLHFVPDNAEAYDVVEQLIPALAPGSYLTVSHGAAETFAESGTRIEAGKEVYRRQTATPVRLRTNAEVARFFTGTKLVDPGIVWAPQWRPAPDDPQDFTEDPRLSSIWAGVATLA